MDKNQFAGSHGKSNARKHNSLIKSGVELIELPLPVGDYILVDEIVQEVIGRKANRGVAVKKMDLLGSYKVAIDTKKSLVEIAGNLCNTKQHDRIRDEFLLAKQNGIRLVLLIENTENVNSIDDLFARSNMPVRECAWKQTKYGQKWLPVHTTKVKCGTLAKQLYTIQKKYDVEIMFTKPSESHLRIMEILGGK